MCWRFEVAQKESREEDLFKKMKNHENIWKITRPSHLAFDMLQQEQSSLYCRWDPQEFPASSLIKKPCILNMRNLAIPDSSTWFLYSPPHFLTFPYSAPPISSQQTTLPPMSKLRLPPDSMLGVHPTKLHFWHVWSFFQMATSCNTLPNHEITCKFNEIHIIWINMNSLKYLNLNYSKL